jgi:hypothetical protein
VAWKNGYYYRNRRIGDKVISEYVGGGYLGMFVEQADEEKRQEAQQKRQAWQATVDAEQELDAMLDEVTALVNTYAGALMLATGHYQHKRQWRKQK